MNRTYLLTIGAALLVVLAPRPGLAQRSDPGQNSYVSFTAMYDASSRVSTTSTEQVIHQETARLSATHDGRARVLFDVTSGRRLAGTLGIGFAATYGRGTADAAVSGDVPHPFFYGQPRALAGVTTLNREDLAIHLSAMWLIPVTRAFQMAVFGGPTWFRVKQDVIGEVRVLEEYPFDTVALGSVASDTRTGSRVGYHAGADASCFFSKHVGVQVLVRYSDGSVGLGGGAGAVKAGGLQVGGGLRIRY